MASAVEAAFGTATSFEVGEWVGGLAKDALVLRAARIREIESVSEVRAAVPLTEATAPAIPSVAPLALGVEAARGESPGAADSVAAGPARRRPRAPWLSFGVAVGLSFGAALAVSALEPKAAHTATPNRRAEPPTPLVVASPAAFPAAPPEASSSPLPSAPPRLPSHRRRSTKGCEVTPFFVDSEGIKRVRTECM